MTEVSQVSEPFFRTGRPTTYKGVKMRSRLEATWAAYFDQNQIAWQYEPQCFANQTGQYLPDFFVVAPNGKGAWVEVKGHWADGGETARRRMEVIYDSDPTATLVLLLGAPWMESRPLGDDSEGNRSPIEPEWYHYAHEAQRGWHIPGMDILEFEWEILRDNDFDYDFYTRPETRERRRQWRVEWDRTHEFIDGVWVEKAPALP